MLALNFAVLLLLLIPNLPFEKGPNGILAELLSSVIMRETNLLTKLRCSRGRNWTV